MDSRTRFFLKMRAGEFRIRKPTSPSVFRGMGGKANDFFIDHAGVIRAVLSFVEPVRMSLTGHGDGNIFPS
jgi:hypothetical protein